MEQLDQLDQLPFPPGADMFALAPRYHDLLDRPSPARVLTSVGDPAWLVTRHQDVAALLGDPRLGRSHPRPEEAARSSASVLVGGPVGDHAGERERHQRLRRLLAPVFSARRMEALRPRVVRLVGRLLDELPPSPADWHDVFSVPLPVLVICELLGVPTGDHAQIRRWADDLASLTDPGRADAARRDLVAYMCSLIPARRAESGEDALSDLLAAQDRHDLTDLDIARTAAMLLFAGHETTVVRLDLGLVLLLSHPGQFHALRADPGLVPGAVEEILRLSSLSTTGGVLRYAHTDTTVGDTVIRAGEAVILAPHAANRNPGVFPDPEAFDITRVPNPHLTFGHGATYCIGAGLARIELQAAFTAIPRRLPDLRLAVPRAQLRLRGDRLTGGLLEVPVAW